ncbi:MAG: hypothetical protein K5745_00515 [Saccharofermentans sp.]|nr:hypothetical protein [Saccharofermentans sp.]
MATLLIACRGEVPQEFLEEMNKEDSLLVTGPEEILVRGRSYKKALSIAEAVEACDKLLVTWDAIEITPFISILMATIRGKPVRMFYAPSKKWADITKIEEFEEYIRVFPKIPDEEQIARSICSANASLESKRAALIFITQTSSYYKEMFDLTKGLIASGTEFHSALGSLLTYEATPVIDKCLSELRYAFKHLSLRNFYVYTDKGVSLGLFDTFENVVNFVGTCGSYKVEEWDIYREGSDHYRYDYFIQDGNICWFDKWLVGGPLGSYRHFDKCIDNYYSKKGMEELYEIF